MAQNGPAITWVTSSTRRPSSARGMAEILMHTIFETDGAIATLTFNRPEARNAMTWEMYEALVAACEQVDRDAAVGVLIIRGAGGKAFVAGTDISQFQNFNNREDGLKVRRTPRSRARSPRARHQPRSRRSKGWRPAAGVPSR